MRTVSLLLLALLAASGSAVAQNGTPESESGRYSFNRVEDGYLRLDNRTGQVSLCSRREAGWACYPVPDERTALEDEIARLQRDNAALKKELVARGIQPPGAKQSSAAQSPKPEPGIKLPSDAEIDKAMAFMEKLWRRLVEMVGRLQREFSTQL